MRITDRTFIVSGGSSGLGLATASNIVKNAGYAAIFDMNPPPSSVDANNVLFVKTDVSSTESLTAALHKTLEWAKSTSAPLSGAICCAGIGTAAPALPRQNSNNKDQKAYYDIKLFDRTLNINLRGTVDLIRLVIPHIADNNPCGSDGERGLIVVVSSVAAYEGQVGQLAYSASKGAVASIVLPLARELGSKAGIRVMGIAPGVFETGMTKKTSSSTTKDQPAKEKKHSENTASKAGINPEMVQYPKRMGHGDEFASLVKEIIENPMLNGSVIRLDGAVRMPSRL